ncbi:MAG: hypothetical protein KZQ70_07795 [gamma proteobacterium symbiont of Lucinoma myriamae]|nr:hypothetical protein [gamma proteobacterium symbiont of Lucinoma myriamae]
MERVKPSKKRRYCEHCKDYVSQRTYFRHKKLVLDSRWNKEENVEESFSSDSEGRTEDGKLQA